MSDQPASASDRYKIFTVLIVDDQEAVRDSASRPPDLILCDINMAPTNGFAFVKWVRLRNSGSFRTPILFLTSHTEREVVMKAKEVGIDGFLVKPVGIADLTVRVDRAMRVYAR